MPNDDRVQIFSRALEAAIRDVLLEQEAGSACRFYFDADVVIGAIYGYAEGTRRLKSRSTYAALESWKPEDDHRAVVQALWTLGFGCRATLFWPHEAEFRRNWRQAEEEAVAPVGIARSWLARTPTRKQVAESEVRVAEQWIATHFTDQRLRRLQRALESARGGASAASSEKLSDLLPLKDYMVAQAIAFASWTDRIAFIGDRLILRGSNENGNEHQGIGIHPKDVGPGIENLSGRERNPRIGKIISMARRLTASRMAMAKRSFASVFGVSYDKRSFADACALSELQTLVFSPPPTNLMVRFYTNTDAIVALADEDSESFSFSEVPIARDSLNYGVLDSARTPFRSDTYMFLRSVVPTLAFRDRRESVGHVSARSVDLSALRGWVEREKVMREEGSVLAQFATPSSPEARVSEIMAYMNLATAVANTWARVDSRALAEIADRVTRIARTTTALKQSEDGVASMVGAEFRIIDDNVRKLDKWFIEAQVASEGAELLEAPAQQLETDRVLAATGVGRWLGLIRSEKEIEKLTSALFDEISGAGAAQSRPNADWLQLAESFDRDNQVPWLFANAVLFSRGVCSMVDRHLSSVLADGGILQPDLQLCALSLRDCARLATLAVGDPVPTWDEIQHEAMGMAKAKMPCELIDQWQHWTMRAWVGFYWCHIYTRSLFGSEIPKWDSDRFRSSVQPVAQQAREGLSIKGFSTGNDPSMMGDYPLMTDVVEILLQQYAEEPSQDVVEHLVVGGSAYGRDAALWRRLCHGRVDDQFRAHVQDCSRHRRAFGERYLSDHLRTFIRKMSEIGPTQPQ